MRFLTIAAVLFMLLVVGLWVDRAVTARSCHHIVDPYGHSTAMPDCERP